MSVTTIVATVVVLAVIALVLALVLVVRNRRRPGLRERFGPEYERAVEETGSEKEAERTLAERLERRRHLDIKELDQAARVRYAEEWRMVQARFVDEPKGAVGEADDLVASLMRELGYPTDGFEQQAADVSVDHAEAVPAYRRAHELATARSEAATDDLRQAMVHYRELFAALLGEPSWRPGGAADRQPEAPPEPATPAEPVFEERPERAGAEAERAEEDRTADRAAARARREGS